MPITQDIRDAIERGDKKAAQALFNEVASKNLGQGLSGHDRQTLKAQIDRIETAPPPPPPPEITATKGLAVKDATKPKGKSSSRKAKVDMEEGEIVAD